MKKLMSIMMVFLLALCSVNFDFVYAEAGETENIYDMNEKTLDIDENRSHNEDTTSLEVYVTDGYSPIANASVSIDGKTAETDENGTVYFEDIQISFEPYSLTVSSSDFGERYNDVIISDSEPQKFTVSFWTPGSKPVIATYADSAVTDPEVNEWTHLNIDGDISYVWSALEYDGYIFFFTRYGYDYVLDTSDNTIAIFTSTYADHIALDSQNGVIYFYHATTIDGPDLDEPERTVSYSFSNYDINTGDSWNIDSGFYGGRLYSDMVAANGKVYLIGGQYLGESPAGKVNEVDYPYVDSYDVDNDEISYRIYELPTINATGLSSEVTGDSSNHVIIADDNNKVYSISLTDDTVTRISVSGTNYSNTSSWSIYNDSLYVSDATGSSDNFYSYDLTTGQKTKHTALPGTQKVYASKVYKDNLYTLWGNREDDETYVGIYNFKDDSWSIGGYDHNNRSISNNSVFASNGKIYAIEENVSASETEISIYKIPTSSNLIYRNPQLADAYGITQIDTFRNQTLAIDSNKKVLAWGEGYYGNGSDNMKIFPKPHEIEGISNAKQVARGKNHNLVLDENGDVWGWGSNSNYPMSSSLFEKVSTPTKISGISGVDQIAAGAEFSIFLKDGNVYGIGKNDVGQLGLGSSLTSIATPTKISFSDSPTIKYIDAGEDYAVAATDTAIYVWGTNSYGQMGQSFDERKYLSTPKKLTVPLSAGEVITKISAGTRFGLILTNLQNVYVWGDNNNGEYGRGDKEEIFVPTKIAALSNIIDISAGVNGALAVASDGTVYGWGYGNSGNIGVSGGSQLTPKALTSLQTNKITKVSLGYDFSIFVLSDGYVYSLGNSAKGSLGTYYLYK